MGARPVRTAVIAGVRYAREGLAHLLGGDPGIDVVATGCGPEDALTCVAEQQPDVLLVDDGVPMLATLIGQVSGGERAVSVLALAVPEDERAVLAYVEAGVAGFLPPEASVAEVIAAVRVVARGEVHFSPRMTAMLLRRASARASARDSPADAVLTPRELEIVDLVEGGLANKEIAFRLCISVATVKNHIHNILCKLNVGSRSEAVARVRELRIIGHPIGHL